MLDAFFTTQIYGFNWVDLMFAAFLVYFVLASTGFIETALEIVGFVLSLAGAYRLYGFAGSLLTARVHISQGIANALGFFITWFIIESVLYAILAYAVLKVLRPLRANPVNRVLGYVVGVLHAAIVFFFLVSLIFAFPVKGSVKKDILQSRSGPPFVNFSQVVEQRIKNVFGSAVSESINFLTVKPKSGETLQLGFTVDASQLSYDPESEAQMLDLVNKERVSRGIPALQADTSLRALARAYGMEMFQHGFFSHTSAVDGSTPAERADRNKIDYTVIGENLAFAPDVYLAHQGLMNSEGHRHNILSPDYHKVGIGIVDGGIYGRMFVQEFSN